MAKNNRTMHRLLSDNRLLCFLCADQCLRVVGKIPELGPGTLSEPFPAHTGMITLCALKALPLYLTKSCAFTYFQQILPNKMG